MKTFDKSKILYFFAIFFFMININFVYAVDFPAGENGPGPNGPTDAAKAKGINKDNIKDTLKAEYDGLFNKPWCTVGDGFCTKGKEDHQQHALYTGYYDIFGIIYYGDYNEVEAMTGFNNTIKNNRARYFGTALDGASPISNLRFPDDLATTGKVKTRNIISNPWSNSQVQNNTFHPVASTFNNKEGIIDWFNNSGVTLEESTAEAMLTSWVSNIQDKYASHHDFWKTWSSNWSRAAGDYSNHINNFSIEDRKKKFYIEMPPTEYTYGQATEWHTCGSSSGTCYDSFFIGPDVKTNNVKATKLEIKKKDLFTYEIYFTIKNIGNKEINQELATYYITKVGSTDTYNYKKIHPGKLEVGQEYKALLDIITVSPDTPSNTKITVYAEINPEIVNDSTFASIYGSGVSKVGTTNRPVDENGVYSDNGKWSSVFTIGLSQSICFYGGYGESDTYGSEQCSTSEDGDTSCWCTYPSWQAYNSANITYINSKQTLLGTWSRNTQGHYSSNAPDATGANIPNDEFVLDLEGELVENLNILGIEKPKRVIRAGRPLQMYGTLDIKLHLENFSGESGLDSKKNAFLSTLRDTLSVKGLEVVPNVPAVKNNVGNKISSGQYDDDRDFTVLGIDDYVISNDTVAPEIIESVSNLFPDYANKYDIADNIKNHCDSNYHSDYYGSTAYGYGYVDCEYFNYNSYISGIDSSFQSSVEEILNNYVRVHLYDAELDTSLLGDFMSGIIPSVKSNSSNILDTSSNLDNLKEALESYDDNYAFTDQSSGEGHVYKWFYEDEDTGASYTEQTVGDYCGYSTKYTKKYWFIIPIKSKNAGGEQATKQGGFAVQGEYDVNNEDSSFYTNINTMNGLNSLEFITEMDLQALDSTFPATNQLCKSNPEIFEIQGNIYDDVRATHKKYNPTEVPTHDNKWDW